jgi:hypothetical protein
MSDKQSCGNCLFWLVDCTGNGRRGECRRYPPAVILIDSSMDDDFDHTFNHSTDTEFPTTLDSTWCGEWKQKDEDVSL